MASWPTWSETVRALVRWWPWRTRSLGERGEDAAARHLQRLGLRIVGRQVRLPSGELDLIALDGRTIVFVEVRTRSATEHGSPADTVDREKQRRLTKLALSYLKRRRLLDHPARFDVVAVVWPPDAAAPRTEHIPSAFTAIDHDGMFS